MLFVAAAASFKRLASKTLWTAIHAKTRQTSFHGVLNEPRAFVQSFRVSPTSRW